MRFIWKQESRFGGGNPERADIRARHIPTDYPADCADGGGRRVGSGVLARSAKRGADGQGLKSQRGTARLLLAFEMNTSAMLSGPTLMTLGSDKQS